MGKRTRRREPSCKNRKTSVANMTYNSLKRLMGYGRRSEKRPRGMCSRSFTPHSMVVYENTLRKMGVSEKQSIGDKTFFDAPVSTSSLSKRYDAPATRPRREEPDVLDSSRSGKDLVVRAERAQDAHAAPPKVTRTAARNNMATSNSSRRRESGFNVSRREDRKPLLKPKEDDDKDILPDWIEKFADNSNRHGIGFNLMSWLFGSGATDIHTKRTRRPYFTYWVTVVQVIIYIVSVASYGFAPVGLGTKTKTDEVLMTSLLIEKVSRSQSQNMWIGPSRDDLIHLGAKYSLCMREDEDLKDRLEDYRVAEKDTACCVFNDGSGCIQKPPGECSSVLNTWHKYTASNPGPDGLLAGSVCGQDPLYCLEPASSGAFEWDSNDITLWPVCTKTANLTAVARTPDNIHMTCELTGRPCCVGIQGECIMATREYCDFMEGYFHEEATLCSQAHCLEEVCGQIQFLDPEVPDQFYRLITSLFLHAGLLQLLITVVYQLIIQRDLEKVIGWWKMTILYLSSGVAGSLGSAIFMPYYVETGPGSAQFGVLGLMCVEVMRWNTDDKEDKPLIALAKILGLVLILFFCGLIFPEVNNFAHIFGLLFGALLCIGFRPFAMLCAKPVRTCTKVICSVLALSLAIALFVMLILLFYVAPKYNCENCWRLNCIPFTDEYCDEVEIELH